VSQPSNRFKDLPALWNVDKSREEIWFGNPWKVSKLKQNLSAFERNQIFLNLSQDGFLNIGYLTKADSDGDGRGVMVADVTGDMQPDLVVCQAGGGPVRIYANRFPPSSRLIVSLEGVASNGLGVLVPLSSRKLKDKKSCGRCFPITTSSHHRPARSSLDWAVRKR